MANEASTAAAGRPALALTRDTDWEDVVRAVNSLPSMAKDRGLIVACAWARTELRSLISVIVLADPKSRAQALARHRTLGIMLSEPFARVMCRDDAAGLVQRTEFLEAVELWCLGPTIQRVFERSAQDLDGGYSPQPTE